MENTKPNLVKLLMLGFVEEIERESKYHKVFKKGIRRVFYYKEGDEIDGEVIYGPNPEKVGYLFLEKMKNDKN